MKQRVALARALGIQPDILLMDEPFSSLDALTREAAQEFLLVLHKARPMTVIVVTHSIEEAVYLSETVFVMTGRNPGTISARFDIPENSRAQALR
jgi:ABC-type nitrate/sulfonate/bicarbonate transport system ATPase subunit